MSGTMDAAHDFTLEVWNRLCEECSSDEGHYYPLAGRRVHMRAGNGIFSIIRFALLDADTHCFAGRAREFAQEPFTQAFTTLAHFRDAFDAARLKYGAMTVSSLDGMYVAQVNIVHHLIEVIRAEIEAREGPVL